MNNQLEQLYRSELKKVEGYYQQRNDLAQPVLLQVSTNYQEADIKLMIFGQETNGWNTPENENLKAIDTEGALKMYDRFFNGDGHIKHGGPFNQTIDSFPKKLQEAYGGETRVARVVNDLIKIGKKNGKGEPSFYKEIVKPHLNALIPQEIAIVRPDFLIFFTGPNYDGIINDIFGQVEQQPVEGFKTRILYQFKIEGVKKAFRTYHPNQLNFRGRLIKNKILKAIIAEASKL